jgi:hypothetical protein
MSLLTNNTDLYPETTILNENLKVFIRIQIPHWLHEWPSATWTPTAVRPHNWEDRARSNKQTNTQQIKCEKHSIYLPNNNNQLLSNLIETSVRSRQLL